MNVRLLLAAPVVLAASLSGCVTTAERCSLQLRAPLERAITAAEEKLNQGCEFYFDGYFDQLLAIGEDRPDRDNKRLFSDHLVRVSELGVISHRQAQEKYNRYFNVKFVSLSGDYNTCSQTCPVRHQVLSSMKEELLDKERGLVKVSADPQTYYRADNLLKETQLVLEATCRACIATVGSR